MDVILIEGGKRLKGEVVISGAKNSTLPIMAATILTDGLNRLENVPQVKDISTMGTLLERLGADIHIEGNNLNINTKHIDSYEAPYELVKTMRASILVLGPLVARFHKAKVSLPGGCAIGPRPVDLHLKALKLMGVDIEIDKGYIIARCSKLRGASIYFDVPTVGGTENTMMAAVLAKGTTVIENAAKEPEVVELSEVLSKMGAKIRGAGTDTITIEGVRYLKPVSHVLRSDRIEAGTYMVASAITHGNVLIKRCPIEYMDAIVEKLKQAGVEIEKEKGGVRVKGTSEITPVNIKTLPYPGFPTDMQAQMMALLCLAKGSSVITETIFENRFMHIAELNRMGADIRIEGESAIIKGVKSLKGAPVMATDLRASACLVLAGLAAKGETQISRIYHLERGYENIEEKLRKLGANIRREKANENN